MSNQDTDGNSSDSTPEMNLYGGHQFHTDGDCNFEMSTDITAVVEPEITWFYAAEGDDGFYIPQIEFNCGKMSVTVSRGDDKEGLREFAEWILEELEDGH